MFYYLYKYIQSCIGNSKRRKMSITGQNTVVITTTMPENEISEKRRKMMIDTMSKFNLPVFFDHGVIGGWFYIHIQHRIMKSRMEQFLKISGGFEYGILCDDDFHCHPNFLEELNLMLAD